MKDNQIQAWRAYGPPVDEVMAPPPAPIEVETSETPNAQQTAAGLIVIVVSNLLVAGIIIGVLLWHGSKADLALNRGVAYFTTTTPIYLIIISGSLTKIFGRIARESTERQRIRSYERVMTAAFAWRQMVETNRMAELQTQMLPAQLARRVASLERDAIDARVTSHRVSPLTQPTFVTPYENRTGAAFGDETEPAMDTTAQEAVAWLSGLYNDVGMPDARRVQMVGDMADHGRLKIRMIGSKRGGGSREAGLWCLRVGAIKKVSGGYRLDLARFPSRDTLRGLL